MAVPDPITRLEKYWAAILDKIQGGGSAPVLETLTATENGTYTPDPGVDGFDEVVVEVPSPNYVETISGTLGNPWGDIDVAQLHQDIINGDASAHFIIDGTPIGEGTVYALISPFVVNAVQVINVGEAGAETSYWSAITANYSLTGDFGTAYVLQHGTASDLSAYANILPTTLTIIHHPLPDSE